MQMKQVSNTMEYLAMVWTVAYTDFWEEGVFVALMSFGSNIGGDYPVFISCLFFCFDSCANSKSIASQTFMM